MAVGGRGVISVIANLVPKETAELTHAALSGDWKLARDLHHRLYPLSRAALLETNPIPIKEAMAMVGMLEPEFRLPMCRMGDANRAKLRGVLRQLGLSRADPPPQWLTWSSPARPAAWGPVSSPISRGSRSCAWPAALEAPGHPAAWARTRARWRGRPHRRRHHRQARRRARRRADPHRVLGARGDLAHLRVVATRGRTGGDRHHRIHARPAGGNCRPSPGSADPARPPT